MFYLLLGSILPEFDQYLAIYTSRLSNGNLTSKDLGQCFSNGAPQEVARCAANILALSILMQFFYIIPVLIRIFFTN
jgi:hypothetical protein